MPSSRGSSQPRDQTRVSRIAGRFFAVWATSKAREDSNLKVVPMMKNLKEELSEDDD